MCPRGPRRLSASLAVRQGQFLLRERRPVSGYGLVLVAGDSGEGWRTSHPEPESESESQSQEEKAGDTQALTMDDEMGCGGRGGGCPGHHYDNNSTLLLSPAYRQKPPMAAIITVWSLTPGVGKNISKGVMRMIHFKVPPSSDKI